MSVSNSDEFQRYLFEYKFDGAEWGIEIKAASPNEARERLKAISWAQYKGEIYPTIPVAPARMSRALARIRAAVGLAKQLSSAFQIAPDSAGSASSK